MVESCFFYILDISVRNIFIFYNNNKEFNDSLISNPSLNFRKILLNEMLNKFSSNALKIKENEIRIIHEYIRGNKDRQAYERCKKLGNIWGSRDSRSNFICKSCDIYLCKECYSIHIKNLINKKIKNK